MGGETKTISDMMTWHSIGPTKYQANIKQTKKMEKMFTKFKIKMLHAVLFLAEYCASMKLSFCFQSCNTYAT